MKQVLTDSSRCHNTDLQGKPHKRFTHEQTLKLLIVKSCINSWTTELICNISKLWNLGVNVLPPQIRLSLFTTPVILNQPFGFAEDVVFTAPPEMLKFLLYNNKKKLKKWFGWQKYLHQLTFHSEATIWKEKQGQCKIVPYGLAHLQSSNGFKIWHFKIYGFLCYLLPFFTSVKLLEISPGYRQLIRQDDMTPC